MAAATDNTVEEKRFEEFSPKKMILSIHNAFKYLLSKWWVLLLCGMAIGLIYVLFSMSKKTTYTAELSFALDDGTVKSTTSNSFSALSQELGFGPTYEAGGVFSSVTNILELLQSRLIVEKTLKRSVTLNGKAILFADFFLDSLDFRRKWMAGSPYEKANFLKTKLSNEEEIFVNGIVGNIHSLITNTYLKVDKKGKGSSLIQATLTTQNEAFSKYFLTALVDEVSKYYVEIKTYRAKIHLEFIQKRTDSTGGSYRGNLYSKAAIMDANVNPALQIATVPVERKQTDIQLTKEAYIDLVKSLEAAKTSLMEETPLFQYLDVPLFPLKKSTNNLTLNFFIFSILGIFLSAGFLLVRRAYRAVLNIGQQDTEDYYYEEVPEYVQH